MALRHYDIGIEALSLTAAQRTTIVTTQMAFGPVVTLSYQATARLRVLLFGGLAADRAASGATARAYLDAQAAAWSPLP